MATHSSILAWKIPWTEEPGGLQSMGCKELDMTDSYDINADFKNYKPDTFLIFVEITSVVWLISVISLKYVFFPLDPSYPLGP